MSKLVFEVRLLLPEMLFCSSEFLYLSIVSHQWPLTPDINMASFVSRQMTAMGCCYFLISCVWRSWTLPLIKWLLVHVLKFLFEFAEASHFYTLTRQQQVSQRFWIPAPTSRDSFLRSQISKHQFVRGNVQTPGAWLQPNLCTSHCSPRCFGANPSDERSSRNPVFSDAPYCVDWIKVSAASLRICGGVLMFFPVERCKTLDHSGNQRGRKVILSQVPRFSEGSTTAQCKHSQSAAPVCSHQVGPKWQCHYEFLAGYSAAALAAVQQWAAAPSAAPCRLPRLASCATQTSLTQTTSQLLRGKWKSCGEIWLGT